MKGQELVKEWCEGRYPMMARDEDYGELDCYDMFEFAEWLFFKLNKGAVSGRSEQLFCDCEIQGSLFQLNTGEICCCKCEKERAK